MKKLMAANWKMYKTRAEAEATAREMVRLIAPGLPEDRELLVFPPFTALAAVAGAFAGQKSFAVGGQNFWPHGEGAFTGEIAPGMLLDAGCTWALAGHSERRWVLGENDDLVGEKVAYGLQKGLSMVLCIGEKLEERRAKKVEEVLDRQLERGLVPAAREFANRLAVAYEPVWAIGTGEVAGREEIRQAHAHTRDRLVQMMGEKALEIPLLYGGSVKPDNASEILALDNVDGVLVGGASLTAESFSRIALA
ncbi:Triosephosphate isomerase, bacterial/eukaryotic [Desulfovibrio sp. X2]|uniref:triose-phosphate isomerase n=1 Tax=Desulfovibrio sp. X2 TaxID=941449 RepID=UPI000358DA6C|nr:triose-phosphate isomerase [Desulfovibrio sp. X2]EPR42303.1 Triosephosphate isomerase, bacterial/eukaryotic [Desulfovibrio sp. X2]